MILSVCFYLFLFGVYGEKVESSSWGKKEEKEDEHHDDDDLGL